MSNSEAGSDISIVFTGSSEESNGQGQDVGEHVNNQDVFEHVDDHDDHIEEQPHVAEAANNMNNDPMHFLNEIEDLPVPNLNPEQIHDLLLLAESHKPQKQNIKLNAMDTMRLLKICIRYNLNASKQTRYFKNTLMRSDEFIFEQLLMPNCRDSWQTIQNSMRYKWPQGTVDSHENVVNSLVKRILMLLGNNERYYDYLYNFVNNP